MKSLENQDTAGSRPAGGQPLVSCTRGCLVLSSRDRAIACKYTVTSPVLQEADGDALTPRAGTGPDKSTTSIWSEHFSTAHSDTVEGQILQCQCTAQQFLAMVPPGASRDWQRGQAAGHAPSCTGHCISSGRQMTLHEREEGLV